MRRRRLLPLAALVCGPGLSFLAPVVLKPPRAVLVHLADAPDGVARFNAQGTWGALTVGGRFSARADTSTTLVFSLRGETASRSLVPLNGEEVTYRVLAVGSRPRELGILCRADRGRVGFDIADATLSWRGPQGTAPRARDALLAWLTPQGLAGRFYQGLLATGALLTFAAARGGGTWATPWPWWMAAAVVVALFPSGFSPLTRLLLPGGCALSTVVLCGAVMALVGSVARRRTPAGAAVVVILAGGLAARLATFSLSVDRPPGDIDEVVYAGMAENLLHGRGFVIPDRAYKPAGRGSGDPVRTAWWAHGLYLGVAAKGQPTAAVPPVYPLFLAALQAVGLGGSRAVFLAQTLLGIATGLGVATMARRMGGMPAGIAALALALLHAPAVAVSGFRFTETVFLFLLVGALALLGSNRPSRQLLSFMVLGGAVLTRSVALVLLPIWPVYVVCTRKGTTRRVGVAGVLLLVLTLAPWVLRNHRVMGASVVGSTFAGKDLFMGNNDWARVSGVAGPVAWDSLPGWRRALLRAARFTPADIGDLYAFPVEVPSEVARDRALTRKVLLFGLVHPHLLLRRTEQRLAEFCGVSPPPESWEHVGQLPFLFFPALLLAAVAVGTCGMTRHAVLLAGSALLLAVTPLLSIAYPRYRLPIDFALFPLAGVAMARILQGLADWCGRGGHAA